MLIYFTEDHIGKVFLCFLIPYGHGKLDLKFLHGRAEKAVVATSFVQNGVQIRVRNRRGKVYNHEFQIKWFV